MNEVLRSILSNGSITTDDGKTRSLESAISPAEGDFLQGMIRSARPRVSLEVGCGYGVSSLYICEALREVNAAKHIIMDPYQHSEFEGIGLANLKRAGYLDIIDFQEAPSYQYLARLTEERLTIDFAFIDGSHVFDYVFVDFFLIDKLLRPGGIVIVDDLSWPSVRSVCRYVLSNLRYQCIGPKSQGLSERTALRNAATRVRQHGIGPLLRAPLRHIIAPAWRILMWRVGQLVKAPVRHIPGSRISLTDSQLNLPYHSNYVALQKLADGYWTRHERPLSSTTFLVDVDLPTDH
jgi:predicted O-methyltransferase YrrM